ncbi:MAG: hypothetical protein ACRDIC_19705 [bacterium]
MPRDGSGTYSLAAGNPVVDGTVISAGTHNTTNTDIATALTASIAKDGQTTPTANLPMGGFRHTNVGAATLAGEYATLAQAQVNVQGYVVDSSGTANTITISPSPAITAYAAGQMWRVKLNTTNTGATTIAVSGLAAKNVLRFNAGALVARDLVQNQIVVLIYDGTQFIIVSQKKTTATKFTASGTWTRPEGCVARRVRLVGGGGGGGASSAASGSGNASVGSGGAGGTYTEDFAIASASSETVTIGSKGTAGAAPGGNGGAGGQTSFGSITAPGGFGGGGSGATTGIGLLAEGGAPGAVGSFSGVGLSRSGNRGEDSFHPNSLQVISGSGGGTPFSAGANRIFFNVTLSSQVGNSADNFGGGGGSGGATLESGTARAGGTGGDGMCVVEEYY